MKLKLALAACLAALALPAAPAGADEAIPGTCYELTIPGGSLRKYDCECLVGIPWVTVNPPPPTFTISWCHVFIPRGGGGI